MRLVIKEHTGRNGCKYFYKVDMVAKY